MSHIRISHDTHMNVQNTRQNDLEASLGGRSVFPAKKVQFVRTCRRLRGNHYSLIFFSFSSGACQDVALCVATIMCVWVYDNVCVGEKKRENCLMRVSVCVCVCVCVCVRLRVCVCV